MFATLLASGLTLGVTAALPLTASADPDPADGPAKASSAELDSHDRELLAEARADKESAVTVILLAEPDQTQAVADQVAATGGTVGVTEAEVGYLRASVPTEEVERVAKIPGLTALDLDEALPLPDPRPDQGGAAATGAAQAAPVPPPGPSTPAANPYMPTNETGSVDFKKRHPEWDGRGVTIGIVDSGVNLDHPALQTTTTGERKIVDWVTGTNPLEDATWRAMLTTVTGPSFTYAGATWTAPAGTFQINRFAESITAASSPGGDTNRDGDTTDRWGVLYDPATHDVWVDVDQDLDFTDEMKMRPYREQFQVNHFGVDNPATPVRDQMPFVVEYREDVDLTPVGLAGQKADFVNIGITEDEHGTHVAGITAANDMFGNAAFDGQAPGAKLVSSRACSWGGGCTASALTDGLVDLVANRRVDIVNISIGGLPALNDGNNARARLYDRLIETYGVQLFISAGNSGPGVNTVGDPSVATTAVSVAAAVSRDSWLANYGSVVQDKRDMFPFSSRGPREDGGFKPNITAPGSAISTTDTWAPGSPVAEAGYALPPGYSMLQGTSMSAPQATGSGALLLSAARAQDKGVTPAQLRRAMFSSARFEADIPAYAQGNGFVDVPGAWSLLKKLPEARTYTSSAPVCTPISDFLATPDQGVGIYNRCAAAEGGHAPGELKSYDVTLTRTSGPAGSVVHNVVWLGNDGTFSSPAQVQLPLGTPVTVTVGAQPAVGAHGAIMRVDDPATTVVDFEVMNTVIASNELPGPSYAWSASGSVERNKTTSYFVTVPEGVAALQVDLSGIAAGSQVRWTTINPYGIPVDPPGTPNCYPNYSDPKVCNPVSRSYANPIPGVWELEVEARRTSPSLNNPYALQARLQGVTVEPEIVELPSVALGVPTPVTWTLTNDFGPVSVTGKGGPLGSSQSSRPSIADQEVQTYQVEVPAGATRFDVAIGNTSDLGADLDLTVYLGTTQVGQSADGDSEESVSLTNPAPGTYTVEIVGYAVPAGTTEYDSRNVFYAPTLGTLDVPASPLALDSGESAELTGTVTALAAPAEGRQLFGEMTVVTEAGAVVGRGQVVVAGIG